MGGEEGSNSNIQVFRKYDLTCKTSCVAYLSLHFLPFASSIVLHMVRTKLVVQEQLLICFLKTKLD